MKIVNSPVLKGSFTLGAADFTRRGLLAATVLVCARLTSPTLFGDYIFLLTFYQIFAVLGAAGLPNTLVRFVARDQKYGLQVAWAGIIARLVYIVPTSAVMYVAMKLLGFWRDYSFAFGILLCLMVVRGTAENIAFIFQGAEDQVSCAKVAVSQSIVTLIATVVICLTSKNLVSLLVAHVLGGVVAAVYGFILLQSRSRDIREPGTLAQARSLLRDSHWLNAGAFVASAYNRSDVLLLRRVLSSNVVALYAAPYRMLDVTQVLPSSLMATILPSLCREGEANSGIKHPRTAMRFLVIVAFALIVLVTVGAPWITFLCFGRNYHGSILVLQILIWATIPMFWNFVLNAQIIANSFDRAILYAASGAFAVNVGLNLLLIAKFGYLACAAVTVITEVFILGMNLYLVSRVGASAWPENFGRLAMTAFLLAGFSVFWTRSTVNGMLISCIFLVLATLSLPIRWRELRMSDLSGRASGIASAS